MKSVKHNTYFIVETYVGDSKARVLGALDVYKDLRFVWRFDFEGCLHCRGLSDGLILLIQFMRCIEHNGQGLGDKPQDVVLISF